MSKIKVLEMIDRPFLGGGQVNLLSLASGLDSSKFEVSVCSDTGGALVEELERRDIPHFPVSIRKSFSRKTVVQIVDILKKQNIDILHTHGGVAGLYGRWAARKSRTPVVIHTLHGIHYLHYRNFGLKCVYVFLEKIFARFTDAVIFVCDSDRNQAKRIRLVPETKSRVIKNGIDFVAVESSLKDADRARGKKEDEESGRSQPVVGTVSRLHRQKGLPYLLGAARQLSREMPGIQVFVVGGGPLKSKLESRRRRLGLRGVVSFLGERKDALQLLSSFDVFVLSSLWEGLPYALMEAAALGRPVVATCVDGVREMITDGRTGLLVPPKDPHSLALALRRLLENRDYALGLGAALKKDLQDRYSLFRMVEETETLYLDLYAKKTNLL